MSLRVTGQSFGKLDVSLVAVTNSTKITKEKVTGKGKVYKCIVPYQKYRNLNNYFVADFYQTTMIDYFDEVTKDQFFMKRLLSENHALRKEIEEGRMDPLVAEPSEFFQKMIRFQKLKREKHKVIYGDEIKDIAVFYFVLGGRRVYESLSKNFAFPSVSTVLQHLYFQSPPIEADFCFGEFAEFNKNTVNVPYVWVAEDDTRLSEGLSYSSQEDVVVGFVLPLGEDGVPIKGKFKFTSIDDVKNYIRNVRLSNYAKLISVYTLDPEAKPYILAIYGTRGSDTSEETLKRWNFITQGFAKVGIKVMGKLIINYGC